MKNTKVVIFILMVLMLSISIAWGASVAKQPPTDTLTVAMSTLFEETFLPWMGVLQRQFYMDAIYEFLIYLDPKTDEPKPGLAEKWEMSADGKTWTFWLRKGIQFNEGWGELTAEDVKYTFERQMTAGPIAATGPEVRDKVANVEAPERYKVVFYLKRPDIELALTIPSNTSSQPIVCKKYLETVGDEKANSHPIGTGPYTLAEHRRGISIKLETIPGVENHWRVTPSFKTITFLRVPEEATRVVMLKTGEVDLAPISYDSIDSIKAAGLHIVSIPKTWVPVIRLGGLIMTDPIRYNPKNPWADKRVRQALNYAIDKDAIAKTIFHGEASPAGTDCATTDWLNIKPYPYDPGKAKQLLAEAGYAKGFPITLKTYTTVPGAELPIIGEAVGMYWKAIDLDVKIVPVDYGTVRSEWTGGKGLANSYAWTHRGMAFISPVMPLQITNLAANSFATFVTTETEIRISQIQNQFDIKKRSELIRQCGEYLRDEAAFIFIVFADEPYGASKKVGQWPTLRITPQNFAFITRP